MHILFSSSGKNLTAEMEDEAEQFFTEVHPDLYSGLISLKLKESNLFPERMFNQSVLDNVKPKNWWTLIQSRNDKIKETKLPEGFCEYLFQLHSCPASSGAIERIFSTIG